MVQGLIELERPKKAQQLQKFIGALQLVSIINT
jgi:hypothetical protein